MNIYFSDYFNVKPETIEKYGAFNVSMLADLPLFVDPFLLFNSRNKEYQELHQGIIRYLLFLRDKSHNSNDEGALRSLYRFQEVTQNWLGFSKFGNQGSGLGIDFAHALNQNLDKIFSKPEAEMITPHDHFEKACLIGSGVGKDHISDFTTNLIKEFLLEYTQKFASEYIDDKSLLAKFSISRVRFNYDTESWEDDIFTLPKLGKDFVILTPKNILTKDNIWINKQDLITDFERISFSVTNEELRYKINNYFKKRLRADFSQEDIKKNRKPNPHERRKAVQETLQEFPVLFDCYIQYKEDNGNGAVKMNEDDVLFSENHYVRNVRVFVSDLETTDFYDPVESTIQEARKKIDILKTQIEDRDGYKMFYYRGEPIGSEERVQLLFTFVCNGSKSDVNREVNNGRGAVDFIFSRENKDKVLVEFKIAKNTKLKQNLEKQVPIYEKANNTKQSLKVIVYFTEREYKRVDKILKELNLQEDDNIILIDARKDNKVSASRA